MQKNKFNFSKNLASLAVLSATTFSPMLTCAQEPPQWKFAVYSAPDLSQYKNLEELENALADIIENVSMTTLTPDGRFQTVHLHNNNQMVDAVANANRQAQQRYEELVASGMSPEEAEEQVISEIHQDKFIDNVPGHATITDGCNIV